MGSMRGRRGEAAKVRGLFGQETEDEDGNNTWDGFSIQRTYPILRSSSGAPGYLQLKWAVNEIKRWKQSVLLYNHRQGKFLRPIDEAIATRAVGRFPSEQSKSSRASERRGGQMAAASKAKAAKPKAHPPAIVRNRVRQVQKARRHDAKSGGKQVRKAVVRTRSKRVQPKVPHSKEDF